MNQYIYICFGSASWCILVRKKWQYCKGKKLCNCGKNWLKEMKICLSHTSPVLMCRKFPQDYLLTGRQLTRWRINVQNLQWLKPLNPNQSGIPVVSKGVACWYFNTYLCWSFNTNYPMPRQKLLDFESSVEELRELRSVYKIYQL